MYKIQGKVVVMESELGIPNLIVQAFDINDTVSAIYEDVPNYKSKKANSGCLFFGLFSKSRNYIGENSSLGSTFTQANGEFTIEYDEDDFKTVGGKSRPKIQVAVQSPYDVISDNKDASPIIYTSRPTNLNGGKVETFFIRIPSAILDLHNIRYPKNEVEKIDEKVMLAEVEKKIENEKVEVAINKKVLEQKISIVEDIKTETDKVFTKFTLSKIPLSKKTDTPYYDPEKGEKLEEIQKNVIEKGIEKFKSETNNPSKKKLLLVLTKEQETELGIEDGKINSKKLEEFVNEQANSVSIERSNALTCKQKFEEKHLDNTIDPLKKEECKDATPSIINQTVSEQLSKMISSAVSPETKLRYNDVIDQCYKQNDVDKSVKELSLRGGPADVTSYHDFNTIQIAFEHIWTEIFDKSLKELGKSLYSEIVEIQKGYNSTKEIVTQELRTGYTNVKSKNLSTLSADQGKRQYTKLINVPKEVNTVDDLEQLFAYFKNNASDFPHLKQTIDAMGQRLSEAYKFDVFAANSVNYGLLFTYRQKWEPLTYQVGRLVSSIPLAPKEVRKYSTKTVVIRTRNQKEMKEQDIKSTSEMSSTSRADQEIIDRANSKTSFNLTASGSINFGIGQIGMQTALNTEAEKFSQATKKNFRESVVKSAEEYRQQIKLEVETTSKDEMEMMNSGEIMNPNDEITVTYLFYELQRRYRISEQLHKITPIILVANEVPTPDQIDYDWLMANAWILKRVILDKMYLPALDYLTMSLLGEELSLVELQKNLTAQRNVIATLTNGMEIKNSIANEAFTRLTNLMGNTLTKPDDWDKAKDVAAAVFSFGFSLIGGGNNNQPTVDPEKVKEAAQLTLERSDKERLEFQNTLNKEIDKLQTATNEYTKALSRRFDMEHQITLLRIHVKENILYYMQAIWDYEPTDQRFFRLYNQPVSWFTGDVNEWVSLTVVTNSIPLSDGTTYTCGMPRTIIHEPESKKLVEVADLDNLLGYKGNYMIFPVLKRSYLHNYMIQDYINTALENTLRDPDEFADHTTQEIIDYLKCVKTNEPSRYECIKDKVMEHINERLLSPRKEFDEIVVPTDSLFIEALPGSHPIMEDFKLVHRALDVKKVQAEVRQMELENLRYAARLVAGEHEDPNFEKQILIKGGDYDNNITTE